MEQEFEAAVQKQGSRVFITLPFDPNHCWGEKARHDIHGTINGLPIRGPLVVDGAVYTLLLGPAWRRDNGIAAGMNVTVRLVPEGPQVTTMAADLATAFAAAPAAREFFNALPTFYRKNYLRWVDSAKRAETRTARIQELMQLLAEGKRER